MAKVTVAAQELVYSLEELVGGKAKSPKATAAPKHWHPESPEQTWSGCGRQPARCMKAVAVGTSPDVLKIS